MANFQREIPFSCLYSLSIGPKTDEHSIFSYWTEISCRGKMTYWQTSILSLRLGGRGGLGTEFWRVSGCSQSGIFKGCEWCPTILRLDVLNAIPRMSRYDIRIPMQVHLIHWGMSSYISYQKNPLLVRSLLSARTVDMYPMCLFADSWTCHCFGIIFSTWLSIYFLWSQRYISN